MTSSRGLWVLFAVAIAGCATAVTPDSSSSVTHPASADDSGVQAPDYSSDDGGGTTTTTTGDDGGTPVDDSGSKPPPPKGDSGSPGNDAAPPPPSGAPLPSAGELLIAEVMYNPSGTEPSAEWIELKNQASSARTLSGLTLVDGSGGSHTIASSPAVVIPANAYAVIVRDKTTSINGGVPSSAILYQYASIILANGTTGSISIKNGSTTLASVPYGQWTSASNGVSIQLKTLSAPSTAGSWCFSQYQWATSTDYGTPGQSSDCP